MAHMAIMGLIKMKVWFLVDPFKSLTATAVIKVQSDLNLKTSENIHDVFFRRGEKQNTEPNKERR